MTVNLCGPDRLCHEHGTCNEATGVCENCESGYSGTDCGTQTCANGDTCNNGGSCVG